MDTVTQINALGLNNNPPSEDIKRAIKESLLPKNIQDLNDLDSEILILEARLEELRTKRNNKDEAIRQLQSIVSPLRSMCSEILGEIFLRCLPTHRHPIVETTECPILLTHVCHFWRQTAILDTRLWSRIYITFCVLNLSSQGREASNLRHRFIKILRKSLNIFEEWLSRAGQRPLSVSLYVSEKIEEIGTFDSVHENLKDQDDVTKEFLEMLARFLPQIENLDIINMPSQVFHAFQPMLDAAKLTQLTSLRIKFPRSSDYVFEPFQDSGILMKAQNLKEISIATFGEQFARPDSNPTTWIPGYISSWTTVTSFSMHAFKMTPKSFLFFLGHAPNLIHVKACIAKDLSDGPSSLSLPAPRHVSLPFLRTLSLIDEVYASVSENGELYRYIDAPGLTWVEYSGTFKTCDPRVQATEYVDGSIVPLLERTRALKKITLNFKGCCFLNYEGHLEQQGYYGEQLKRIFRAVPSITHLVLGNKSEAEFSSHWSNQIPNLGILTLRELTSDNRLVLNVHPDSPHRIPLLPDLVSLKIFQASNIDDQDVIEFITSCLQTSNPEGSIGRIQLRHIGIVFPRLQEVDIAAEIHGYAERVGLLEVVPDLWFKYPHPWLRVYLPTRGLNWDGTMWPYEDAEELSSRDL